MPSSTMISRGSDWDSFSPSWTRASSPCGNSYTPSTTTGSASPNFFRSILNTVTASSTCWSETYFERTRTKSTDRCPSLPPSRDRFMSRSPRPIREQKAHRKSPRKSCPQSIRITTIAPEHWSRENPEPNFSHTAPRDGSPQLEIEERYDMRYRVIIPSMFIALTLALFWDVRAATNEVTVYKTTTCNCCGLWVKHMRDNGFL